MNDLLRWLRRFGRTGVQLQNDDFDERLDDFDRRLTTQEQKQQEVAARIRLLEVQSRRRGGATR